MFSVFLVMAVISSLLTGCGNGDEATSVFGQKAATTRSNTPSAESETLRIKTATGVHLMQIELALSEAQQRKGLMFRREMPDDHGMLFVYDEERPIGMWMKNTILPLDMLFVSKDGTIVKIERNTEPFSERVISSGQPVLGVLELNAGTADRLAIKLGDHLVHPLFGNN